MNHLFCIEPPSLLRALTRTRLIVHPIASALLLPLLLFVPNLFTLLIFSPRPPTSSNHAAIFPERHSILWPPCHSSPLTNTPLSLLPPHRNPPSPLPPFPHLTPAATCRVRLITQRLLCPLSLHSFLQFLNPASPTSVPRQQLPFPRRPRPPDDPKARPNRLQHLLPHPLCNPLPPSPAHSPRRLPRLNLQVA